MIKNSMLISMLISTRIRPSLPRNQFYIKHTSTGIYAHVHKEAELYVYNESDKIGYTLVM